MQVPWFSWVAFLIALGCGLAFYALRALRRGRIYLGFRGNIETWGDRQKAPELFWFGVVAALFAACCLFFGAASVVIKSV